ncbi:MAG: rod shape-determining protein MreC [Kiritimatiellae bacterium]|nr:rod shape-determining protein MreC [Kiritimatiellia bacterium]
MKRRTAILAGAAAAAAAAGYFAAASALGPSLRGVVREANAPYGRAAEEAPGWFARQWAGFSGGAAAARERDGLRAELDAARASLLELDALRAENAELRTALGLAASRPRLVPAEVLSEGGGAGWWRSIRLSRGRDAGIAPGCPVICPEGLVGRVVSATATTADVLLLCDAASQVACVVQGRAGGARGVLRGGGVSRPDSGLDLLHVVEPLAADYLGKDLELRPGDRVLTSGLGDVYPAGIPVGVVTSVAPDSTHLFQRAEVAPFADFASLRLVFALVPPAPEEAGQ